MKRWVWVNVAVVLALCGCAERNQPLTVSGVFNRAEVAWAEGSGRNGVSGFAVLRTVGGEARTCAGMEVTLTPDSDYARERFMALYQSTVQGNVPVSNAGRLPARPPGYAETTRTTRCDGQGSFTFENVPDGTWYLAVAVAWMAPGNPLAQGSLMFKRVELRGGTTTKVVLP